MSVPAAKEYYAPARPLAGKTDKPDEGLDLDYVPREARPLENGDGPVVGISNAFGFAGP